MRVRADEIADVDRRRDREAAHRGDRERALHRRRPRAWLAKHAPRILARRARALPAAAPEDEEGVARVRAARRRRRDHAVEHPVRDSVYPGGNSGRGRERRRAQAVGADAAHGRVGGARVRGGRRAGRARAGRSRRSRARRGDRRAIPAIAKVFFTGLRRRRTPRRGRRRSARDVPSCSSSAARIRWSSSPTRISSARVDGALFASFVNAGQACVSAERIYVERPLVDEFSRRLAGARARAPARRRRRAAHLRAAARRRRADLGCAARPSARAGSSSRR